MQDIILEAMFWNQVQTAFICGMLLLASGLYISILPWRKEELERSNQAFLRAVSSTKRKQLLLRKVLIED